VKKKAAPRTLTLDDKDDEDKTDDARACRTPDEKAGQGKTQDNHRRQKLQPGPKSPQIVFSKKSKQKQTSVEAAKLAHPQTETTDLLQPPRLETHRNSTPTETFPTLIGQQKPTERLLKK